MVKKERKQTACELETEVSRVWPPVSYWVSSFSLHSWSVGLNRATWPNPLKPSTGLRPGHRIQISLVPRPEQTLPRFALEILKLFYQLRVRLLMRWWEWEAASPLIFLEPSFDILLFRSGNNQPINNYNCEDSTNGWARIRSDINMTITYFALKWHLNH